MKIEYHPAVANDVAEAFDRYDAVSRQLGDDFQEELRRLIVQAGSNPNRFHIIKVGLHRANLRRFPYHFLYRQLPDGIRVTLVRHHRRNPNYGLDRS